MKHRRVRPRSVLLAVTVCVLLPSSLSSLSSFSSLVLPPPPLSSSQPQRVQRLGQLLPSSSVPQEVKGEELRARGVSPLLVLVNKRAGGGAARSLVARIRSVLPRCQVSDVRVQREALKRFSGCAECLKLLVCGGDGTVSRLVHELFDRNMSRVPLGLVPAGTGNDLANVLYSRYYHAQSPRISVESLCKDPVGSLSSYINPEQCKIDVWNIQRSVIHSQSANNSHEITSKSKHYSNKGYSYVSWLNSRIKRRVYDNKTMVNYFSLGVDSHVSLNFDMLRQMRPHLFISQVVNKLWYGILGLKVWLQQPVLDLSSSISLVCDDEQVAIPKGTKGIILLNVDSYAGGSQLWEASAGIEGDDNGGSKQFSWKKSSPDDGMLEVVAVDGLLHLGAIKGGLATAKRIAQGRSIEIETRTKLPVQIDGEPFVQKPVKMKFDRRGSARILIPMKPAT